MKTKIYCVFPACGKTFFSEHQEDYGLKILDLDSSEFNWIRVKGVREANPEFPGNYLQSIKDNIGKYDVIFVSTHKSVMDLLDREGIDFTVVYPEQRCEAEWIGRCFIRDRNGETGCGAETMYKNYDQWFYECCKTGIDHEEFVLGSNEYLSDYFEKRWV